MLLLRARLGQAPNNGMQRTALRAAADAGRSADKTMVMRHFMRGTTL